MHMCFANVSSPGARHARYVKPFWLQASRDRLKTDQLHPTLRVGAIESKTDPHKSCIAYFVIKLEVEFRVYYSFGEATVTRKENKGRLT